MNKIIMDTRSKIVDEFETRTSARAICFEGQKILMVYIKKYDFYSFPGGGVEANETVKKACVRETEEETGYIVEIKDTFLVLDEYRDSKYYDDKYFLMKNYFYLCHKISQTTQKLSEKESIKEYIPVWISPKEAIEYNQNVIKSSEAVKSLRSIDRDTLVLEQVFDFAKAKQVI